MYIFVEFNEARDIGKTVDGCRTQCVGGIIDKPGKGSFYATDLEHVLRLQGITHLVVAGLTTDVCVHTTIRDANDRGFETLILRDCTAATETRHRDAIFTMTEMQGGLFGATATSDQLLAALTSLTRIQE